MIAKILAKVGVNFEGESVDAIHCQINSMSLSQIKVWFFQGELRNDPIEEEKVEAHTVASNEGVMNTILAISRENSLALQILDK